MNEELKIIIRAITADAQKNIEKVKKDLDSLEKTGKKSGSAVDKAMKGFAKGIGIAVAAVSALTTAMIALGKQSLEFQKNYNRLTASFQSSGSTMKQAAKTYKELFRFMGDSDTATEASNLLVQLTNDEKKLAEWTNILQGVYAKFPDSLPVEALAESANETARVGKVSGNLADALNWVGVSEDAFNAKLATTNSLSEREAMIRETLTALYGDAAKAYEKSNQSLMRYNESQANVDIALAHATQLVIPLMTAFNNLSATLLSVLAPAISTISTYLTAFIELLTSAIAWVGNFFGVVSSNARSTGADVAGYQKAMENYNNSLQKSFKGASKGAGETLKAVKELKKQTMGFDELNVLQSPVSTGGAAAGGGGSVGGNIEIPKAPNPADFGLTGEFGIDLEQFKKDVEEAKEHIKGLLVLVGLVAAGLLAWKLGSFISDIKNAMKLVKAMEGGGHFYQKVFGEKAQAQLDGYKQKLKTIGGVAMIVAGAILLIKGYSDAWANGIDWENFATMLAGIGLIVGGMALAFGPLAAAIGLIVGGIALLVIGIKDLIENGYSMEAVIAVAVGAIAVLIGVVWALNAALLANPITWIVVAIMALVAAFVILWNECEGFRNFWIGLWEKVKQLFSTFVESIRPLIDSFVNMFKEAWALIKVIWNDYLVPLFKWAWDTIKKVWDAVKPYYEGIWIGIKTIFSVVGQVLGGFFKSAWEIIKGVWSVVVSYFKTIFDNIALVFSAVRKVLSGNFKGAWDDIKKIFSNVGSFFTGVWNTIKNVFSKVGSTIGSTITNTVKTAINGVLSSAIKIINGFIGAINLAISVINAIPGVDIKKLDKMSVPKLAKGGIVDSATLAVIGERGKEAVMPLENNTGWMDTLADRIASRNGGSKPIYLMVDKRVLGQVSAEGINDITKLTGEIPLLV